MIYDDATIADLPKEVTDGIAKARVQEKGLFIYGDTGTGKTHALYAIANTFENCRVENWVGLLVEYRSKISERKSQYEFIKQVNECNTLIIDDVGAEKQTESSQELFYLILDWRYTNEKKIILSTNLSLKEFQEKYGDRLFSRVAGMCEVIELKGEDRRLN